MKSFKVALLQILPCETQEENREKGMSAYRRPERYGQLVCKDIKAPFIRKDYRK